MPTRVLSDACTSVPRLKPKLLSSAFILATPAGPAKLVSSVPKYWMFRPPPIHHTPF